MCSKVENYKDMSTASFFSENVVYVAEKRILSRKVKRKDLLYADRAVIRFPPLWPEFDPRFTNVGCMVDKVAPGQVFSEYVGFACQFSFHQMLHTHLLLSTGAGTIEQLVADIPSGLSLTHPKKLKKKKKKLYACSRYVTPLGIWLVLDFILSRLFLF
jgi:hypothetical protein